MALPERFLDSLLDTILIESNEKIRKNALCILQSKEPALKKKFELFCRIIRVLSFLKTGKSFEKLTEERRVALLSSLENSSLSAFRRGFWGLRSLAMLAAYTNPARAREIGFPEIPPRPGIREFPPDPYSNASSPGAPRRLYYDIVIIGSGAGGGLIAEQLIPLAQKGVSIAILESGPLYRPEFFNQREIDMSALFWSGGGIFNEEGSLTLTAGRMAGGSTCVYTGVTFDLPEDVFREWNIPDLRYEDLKKRFQSLRERLNVHVLSPEEVNRNNSLFREGAEKLGYSVKDLEICTRGCRGSGTCNIGCVNDAKVSVLNEFLPGIREAGISLLTNCHAREITEGRVLMRAEQAPEGTVPSPDSPPPGDYEIDCRRTILAAGAFGTNVLLSRSKKNLPRMSPLQGRGVNMHPTLMTYGRFPERVEGFRRFPKTYYVDEFSRSEHYILETAFYHPGVTAKNIEGWGREHRRRMDSYGNLMGVILLVHEPTEMSNRIRWDGRPVLDYHVSSETIRSLRQAQVRAGEIFFAVWCDEAYLPFAPGGIVRYEDRERLRDLVREENYLQNKTVFASAHPMGGCRMGGDPGSSVCDSSGRLRGHERVYIADSSLFPAGSHVNPYLTVMALAQHVGETVIADENEQTPGNASRSPKPG